MDQQETTTRQELDRIRGVYAERAARGRERRYSLFAPAHLFHAQSLERAMLHALRREGYESLAGLRILDVGCGGGSWLNSLTRYGADPENLYGIELRRAALPADSSRLQLTLATGSELPFATASFDLVCQLTMLSSVLDQNLRRQTAAEMLRVVRPSGLILWYDFTVNPFNPDVRGIGKSELLALFAGAGIRAARVTLAPPLTRLLAPRAWTLCVLTQQVPWLRTHLLATIRRTDHSGT